VKVGVYGEKWAVERTEKLIAKSLRDYPIAEARIYLKAIPKECSECMYFPCCKEERCKYARR
jgi:hypothetical protein